MSRYKNLKLGLKSQDFIFKDGWHDSRIKVPGAMHGQQFQMSDCSDSELFIFDSSACVYIDRCKGCYIFIGPTQGSIFIRNCQECIVIGSCKQFRVRDCNQCVVALWCESQPVIESSKDMIFDCFPNWGYPQLKSQMEIIGFQVWNNNWWDIYDFTKPTQGYNYKMKRLTQKDLRKERFVDALNKINLSQVQNVIPKTYGIQSGKQQKYSILVCKSTIPIKLFWMGYKIIQTRICIPGSQLNAFLNLPQSLEYVFAKVSYQDVDNFMKLAEKQKNPCIKRLDQGFQTIHDLIFVPFKDQH